MKEIVQNSLGASPVPSNVPMSVLLAPFAPVPPLLPLYPPLVLLYPFITLVYSSLSKFSVSLCTHIYPNMIISHNIILVYPFQTAFQRVYFKTSG